MLRCPPRTGIAACGDEGLVALGNTSILLGMQWATALLDPGARSMYDQLIGENARQGSMGGRPFDYDSTDSMKVIVLMTDGEHVVHERMADAYKTGTSPIYRSNGDSKFSIYHNKSGTSDYWVPHRNEWRTAPWNSGSGVQQQTWQQVWSRVRVPWVSWQLYARALGTSSSSRTSAYNNGMDIFQDYYQTVGTMNSRLAPTARRPRSEDILIYGIAFEAPDVARPRSRIVPRSRRRPTSSTRNGLNIGTAFELIAANLSQLRLTQ